MRVRLRGTAGILATACAVVTCALSGATAACSGLPGARIVLASDPVDPQVFLWDSRERLAAYAAGEWGSTRAVFAHTLLAEPGTQAVAIACYPDVVKTREAVGVKILSGPYRGRFVWVLSSDVHLLRVAGVHGAGDSHPKVPQSASTR